LFWLPVCAFVCATGLSRPSRADDQSARTARVQHVVDELKSRLDIPQTVTVRIVEDNPLMASVGRDLADPSAFAVSFEADLLDQLSDDALAAAVAHELGHVWIFTHFPFLQTEQLANEIAMRVVSRESLAPVYAQVFERARVAGDLEKLLGDAH
jgi:predicted Zn-dependent protease